MRMFPSLRYTAVMRTTADLRRTVSRLRKDFEGRLAELVDIPSVSVEPERKADVLRCADMAAGFLRDVGGTVQIAPTKGYPMVVGKLGADPSLPTVSIYNHLDVQPADPSEWKTSPFKFSRKGERYFGRGTTDDKGPALAALLGARLAIQDGAPINIQFLWENEEEIGSPNFEQGLSVLARGKKGMKGFATDSVAVSDTIWISKDRPALPVGLRGLCGLTVKLSTGAKDVHSGTTGGAARNPLTELAALVADCVEARTGKIKIPGFYDDVKPLSVREQKSIAQAGFSRRTFMAAHELTSVRFSKDADLCRAIMARPTFEVHGLTGGYRGPGIKTIVPARGELKLSMRLVPDQDPRTIFAKVRAFILKRIPDAVVEAEGLMQPYLGDLDGRELQAAARAVTETFGRPPAMVREGGSIGAVLTMRKLLRAPVVLMGLSLPEHGYHAPNENFDWTQASGGIEMFYRYFWDLARAGAQR